MSLSLINMNIKKIILIISLIISCTDMFSQNFSGTVRDSASHKVLDFVSVVLLDAKRQPLSFQHTNAKGGFSLAVPEGKNAALISFTMLGYAKKTYMVSRYKNGQTVYLHEEASKIKEVSVKAKRLQLSGDTLSYSVAGFKQKQDRSIADVIAKMPGLDVKENGAITFQGQPISKFYIEGMDLMGGKYAMASENLSANKVKKVEVLQRHQPIKALRGKSFSDQAALNLVLTDEAKAAWSSTLAIGAGAQIQKGEGEDLLRDGKFTAMRFGKKSQSISMYKWNNTGKDLQHEILDLARESNLNDNVNGWIGDISVSSSSLAKKRYVINDTHLLATNWLAKVGKDKELRMQATYLFDNTIGKKYSKTIYTNILGQPAIEEETSASKYRSELTTEMQYKVNSSKNYMTNIFRSTFNWNHSTALNRLGEDQVNQYVRPRKIYIGDEFSLLHNLSKQRSFSFVVDASYCHLPSLLSLYDSSMQHLAVSESQFSANTTFRHKLLGFKVSYEAELKYKREEGKLTNTPQQKEYMQEVDGKLTPSISYSNSWGLSLSASALLKLARFDLTQDNVTKLNLTPSFMMSYKITSTTDAKMGYRGAYSVMPFSSLTSLPYYNNYITKLQGDGKWNDIKTHYLWGEFNYGNPLIGFFFYLKGSYNRNSNVPLYTSWLEGNIYHGKISEQHSSSSLKNLSANISKSFGMGKLTIDVGGDGTWSNYDVLLSEEKVPYQNRFYNAYLKLAIMPCPQFAVEEKSSYDYSKIINKQESSLNSESYRTTEHELSLFYMPGKWKFEWSNSLSHSNDKNVSDAYFSDASISLSLRRFDIDLSLSNIFGTRKYERQVINNSYIHYSVNHLRPREILCRVSLYL